MTRHRSRPRKGKRTEPDSAAIRRRKMGMPYCRDCDVNPCECGLGEKEG